MPLDVHRRSRVSKCDLCGNEGEARDEWNELLSLALASGSKKKSDGEMRFAFPSSPFYFLSFLSFFLLGIAALFPSQLPIRPSNRNGHHARSTLAPMPL